jgi:hypothetical protein
MTGQPARIAAGGGPHAISTAPGRPAIGTFTGAARAARLRAGSAA